MLFSLQEGDLLYFLAAQLLAFEDLIEEGALKECFVLGGYCQSCCSCCFLLERTLGCETLSY